MKKYCSCLILCFLVLSIPLVAQPGSERSKNNAPHSGFSLDQRTLGISMLYKAVIGDGKLIVTVPTGGCTDKSSFKLDAKKEAGLLSGSSHYILTLVRIKIDECKAFFPDGEEIVFDLEKDLGLKGNYTISLANPIKPMGL
jgi:hypothetical protein